MLKTALIVASLLLGQTEPTADDLVPQVRKLVKQLGSPELTQRDAAEESLIELGPNVLDILQQLPQSPDAETNQRLDKVRDALYRLAVEAATQASIVTLKAEAMPLSDVLKAMEKQTGNRVVDKRAEFGQEAVDIKITAEFDKVPFWQALDQLLDQAKMTTYNYSGEAGATAIIANHEGLTDRAKAGVYSGVFRFQPVLLDATRDLRNPDNKVLKLFVEVAWEPRMLPIAMAQSLDAVKLTDENGKPIEVAGAGVIETEVNKDISATELEIPLALPPRSVEKIASLEGNLAVLVPGRVETFTFEQLTKLKDAQQQKAGATVIVQTVRKNGDVYEVRMVLRFDKAANALESHRTWVSANEAYLLDGMGKKIEIAGFETTRQTENEVGFAYKFVVDGTLDGHKFVYRTPAAIVQKVIPYELKDIPLP